jgi:hypothetical protein
MDLRQDQVLPNQDLVLSDPHQAVRGRTRALDGRKEMTKMSELYPMGLDKRQYTPYSTYMTSNTMTISIALPRANYTSRQYELYSTPGHGLAAKTINSWMDTEIAAKATEVSLCRGDAKKVRQLAQDILSAVTKRIYAAKYHSKYGATDTEPEWLISKHITKVCCQIGGLDQDALDTW